jgi:NitT/TauT family transport system permease protein
MYSEEHLIYLKKERKKNFIIKFFQFIIIIFFLIIWQFLADTETINTFITSSPKEIIKTLFSLSKQGLFEHIFVTVYETIFSFSLGTIIGIVIAAILWWNNFLFKILDPYLTILNSLPKVALGPIIIIWCGSGIKSIIIMALLISVIITIINISACFNDVDENKIKLFKSLKANKKQLFFKLILPSSLNSIISSLKINISMSLIGVIMGEFLVSKKGIGYLILYGSQIFNLNLVMTGIIVLCIVAAIMYYIVLYFEKKLTHNS